MAAERPDAQRDAAAVLRQVLALVAAGEMTAPPAMVRRLEGAVTALEAVSDA